MSNKRRNQKRPGKPARTRARAFAVAGPVLRALRVARGWTQEEASERAGVSDRLIRKAEAGGPLELKSIALLAQLYSAPDAPLTPSELMPGRVEAVGEAAQSAAHEALVRRWWEEVWNRGRLDAIAELLSPDCVLHTEGTVLHGPVELRQRTEALRAAFSDIHIDVEQVTVHDDWVISRWRVGMTHRGPWMGTPPTHKRVEVNGSTWVRVENGLLREGWDYWEQQQAVEAVRGERQRKLKKKR